MFLFIYTSILWSFLLHGINKNDLKNKSFPFLTKSNLFPAEDRHGSSDQICLREPWVIF